jgi:hypothetical protein
VRPSTLSVDRPLESHTSAPAGLERSASSTPATRHSSLSGFRALLDGLTFDRLSGALLFVALGTAACFMPAQSDTWWHLRTGEEIWRTGSVQLRDSFSHTVNGGYWPNHEWLSQVVFFGLFRAGGLPLFTAAAALLVSATWWMVWSLAEGHPTRRLVLVSLAVIPSAMAWSLRPQLFTLFLVALMTSLVVRRRYGYLPLLFLMWANLHGAVVLGIALLVGSIAAAAFHERRVPRGLLVSSALCLVATVMTPLKLSLWSEIPASLSRLRQYQVLEWRTPSFGDVALLPFWLMSAALTVLTAAALVGRRQGGRANTALDSGTTAPTNSRSSDHTVASGLSRKPQGAREERGVTIVISALILLPFALTSSRNVPPFLLLAAPAIAFLIESHFAWRAPRMHRHERPVLNLCVLAVAVIASVTTVGNAWASHNPRLQWHPLPAQAIAAIRACPERLYNNYDDGGYLIWFVPERKVFLDSRQDPYPASLIQNHIQAELSGNYQALFSRYQIECALTRTGTPLANRLSSDGWHTRYADMTWQVFSR